MAELETSASEMQSSAENAKRFNVNGTSASFWLIKAGTPEAQNREADKGSILSAGIILGGQEYILARR